MPPTGPLGADQIDIIKRWIDQGAPWPDELAGDAPPLPVDANASAMIEALRRGDRPTLKKMLSANPAAATKQGAAGISPLMAATLYGDAATMKLLLDAGADPNVKNEAGATALMWAVPDAVKMRLLMDRGADVNARSDDGRTPLLITAGYRGSVEALRLLLDRGANPSVKTTGLFGETTPLLEAAHSGDQAMFQLLADRGADLKAAGPVALALAYKSRCVKCADLLLSASPPPVVNIAASLMGPPLGDARSIKTLIERGADPKATDQAGRTLLMLAASSDVVPADTVKLLIDRGADVNARSPSGDTALSFARMHGATPIVDLLLKAGAKGDVMPMSKLTPSPAASPVAAIERTIPLLQKADTTFSQKAGCVSCHNNTLTAMSVAAARKQGVGIDEQIAGKQLKTIGAFVDSWRERMHQGVGIPGDAETVSYILLGMAAEGYPADAATDAGVRFLKGKQWPDGHWEPLAHRPPLEASNFAVTAFSMRAMQLYAPAAQRAEYARAVKLAASWLANNRPSTHDDRVFQLLGLGWSSASQAQDSERRPSTYRRATCRRRLVAAAITCDRRLCHRSDGLRAARKRRRAGDGSGRDAWRPVPAEHPTRGRIVVREGASDSIAAVLRKRIPTWERSVDLGNSNELGNAGACARGARCTRFVGERVARGRCWPKIASRAEPRCSPGRSGCIASPRSVIAGWR